MTAYFSNDMLLSSRMMTILLTLNLVKLLGLKNMCNLVITAIELQV